MPFSHYASYKKDDTLKPPKISGHPNIYALKATISYGEEGNEYPMSLVQQTLKNSPSLRELGLHVTWGGGCVVSNNNQPYAFDFMSSNGRFPLLTSFKDDGYGFGDKTNDLQ